MKIIGPVAAYNIIPMVAVLLLFTFLGMSLFPYLRPNTELNQFDQNYRTFFKALFSLLKFSTWEAPIDQIINASQPMAPNFICFQINTFEEYARYGLNGCGSKLKSYLFFLTFHIIYSMIMLTTLTASIFNSFCEAKKQEEITINEFQLEKVVEEWINYDKQAIGFLPYHNFWRFVSKVHLIYGLSDEKVLSIQNKSEFLKILHLPIYNEQGVLGFQFYEIIEGLTRIMLCKKHGEPIRENNADIVFSLVN